ncbi:methyltransferase domain-containing protein [Microcystis wesenbergii FACHB-1317]|jgi:predicted SAM-dependent methyltransferase|uniref:class I SAM-dependent methyltransferase n=1 Tax=Microcystis TaxID=1125 RepID=UPI000E36A859|nr:MULTISPECIES: methyltransferase domain-containing protein [Microcystis]MBD2291847.1 methyltransferase domain-containing protein [Microcystis wesenbergii FACHB-1317]REJ59431.1 MAG: methyltransferase domain-containing protein [Microcystis aeruginosa TA09]UZO74302.1 methyltransferase domain-containing protein [Microcystis aeruginosa str. Chao 1910]
MRYLNLGCGSRFHPKWINLDFIASDVTIITYDLNKGIPYPDHSIDMVYHSHVLEHFTQKQGEFFLQECYRVLKPQGIIRVVVPDLEKIARSYLEALEKVLTGDQEWESRYYWILLEMYDQVSRNISGGSMLEYLLKTQLPDENFIIDRCGLEIKQLIELSKQENIQEKIDDINIFKKIILKFNRIPNYLREKTIKLLLGREYQALQIGRFRQSGEIHQWMYDRYSLSSLLQKCGFTQIIQRTAQESYLTNWTQFNLDTEPDHSIYKPDSIYIEAIK